MQSIWISKKCPKCGGNVISNFDEYRYIYILKCQNPHCKHEVDINVREIGTIG